MRANCRRTAICGLASWFSELQRLIPHNWPEVAKREALAAALSLLALWLGPGAHALAESATGSTREELYAEGLLALNSHDYELAFDILLPLAEQGHSDAQSKIAHMYYWGEGREPDYVQHFEWSLRSAHAGNPIGQFDVATDYSAGRGVAMDVKAAVHWTVLAAKGGDDYAPLALAVRFLFGEGVAPNLKRGKYYLNLAIERNEPRAMMMAAENYLHGIRGFEQNPSKGLELIRRAAEHQHAGAQLSLGRHLMNSATTKEEAAQATKWVILSQMAGCERAHETLDVIWAMHGSDIIDHATRLAEEWLETTTPRSPHDHRNYRTMFCDTAPILNAWQSPAARPEATQTLHSGGLRHD